MWNRYRIIMIKRKSPGRKILNKIKINHASNKDQLLKVMNKLRRINHRIKKLFKKMKVRVKVKLRKSMLNRI